MEENQNKILLIKASPDCEVSKELIPVDGVRDRVQKYIDHTNGFAGLKKKHASNFRLEDIREMLESAPKAAFLRVYLATDKDESKDPVMIVAATDEKGNVFMSTMVEECCGCPPCDDAKFIEDPFLHK
ncbi:hypothetical protein GCM10028807_30830 [Spirosoma daeguense]